MADSIIVLDPKTRALVSQTLEDLELSKVQLSEPTGCETHLDEVDAAVQGQTSALETAKNAVKGASQEDVEDLARRTGDMSVYLYYYQSIGPARTLGAMLILVAFTFASNFPRFWLQWYTDDPVPRFSVFIGVYFMLVIVASLTQGAMIW
jgi:ATP-binding cassette, subfamily C (CFTR/MRP), member 1